MRTMKSVVQESVRRNVDIVLNVWQWLVAFCAVTFKRHKVGAGGVTPCKIVKDWESNAPIAAFGEHV